MRRFHREERGQAIVLIAIVAGVLLLGVGIAIDTGQLYVARRSAQTAADSAAWAGAVVIHDAGTSGFSAATATAAENAAIADAALNGYTIAAADVNVPPASGSVAGDPGFVEVSITTQVTAYFFPGPRSLTVRAVAGASRTGAGEALHVVHDSQASAFNLIAAGRVFITGGSAFARSTASTSLNIDTPTGGIGLTTPAGSPARTRGGVPVSDVNKISPNAVTAATDVPDPFSGLPTPPTTGCDPAAPTAACASRATPATGGVKTILPGIYTSISITSGTTTLSAGRYIVRGTFNVSGTGNLVMAAGTTGVLIFATHSTYPAAGSTCGAITFSSSGTVALQPRLTGSYAGMTIFHDRVCTTRMTWSGTGARTISGTIYKPAGAAPAFRITGAITVGMTGQIVVSTFEGNDMRLDLAYDRARVFGARAPVLIE